MAEFGNELTLAALGNIGAPEAAITQMVAHGVRKNHPNQGALTLVPGSVLVFFANATAGHSCVAVQPQVAAGYNQTGWWSWPGLDHGYSMHQTSQLRWGTGNHRNNVLSGATWYDLYEVPEGTARGIIRGLAF